MHYTELNREAQLRALSDACSTLANDKDKYTPVIDKFVKSDPDIHNAVCSGTVTVGLYLVNDEIPFSVWTCKDANRDLLKRISVLSNRLDEALKDEFLYWSTLACAYPQDDMLMGLVMNTDYNEDGTIEQCQIPLERV
jgi:hypothetical protein